MKRTQTTAPATAIVGAGVVARSEEPMLGVASSSSSANEPPGWLGGIMVLLALAGGLVLAVVVRRRRREPLELDTVQATAEAMAEMPALPVPVRSANPPQAGDENIPRWRRPSVAAARYGNGNTSTLRSGTADSMIRTRPARAFAEPTEVLGERLVVRYGVPLLNQPDEAFGRALENLASGDQVEILDQGEVWANVITPSGAAGWVPSATLGPTAGRRAGDGEETAHAPEQGESPQVAEPPTLEALLEAARRAREEATWELNARPAPDAPHIESEPIDDHEHDAVAPGSPADGDDRRRRLRRRPKVRSASRGS